MLVYKYRGGDDEDIFNRDLTSLKNNLFFAPKHEKLNDPCEALILTDKFVEQTKSISFLFNQLMKKCVIALQWFALNKQRVLDEWN